MKFVGTVENSFLR